MGKKAIQHRRIYAETIEKISENIQDTDNEVELKDEKVNF